MNPPLLVMTSSLLPSMSLGPREKLSRKVQGPNNVRHAATQARGLRGV